MIDVVKKRCQKGIQQKNEKHLWKKAAKTIKKKMQKKVPKNMQKKMQEKVPNKARKKIRASFEEKMVEVPKKPSGAPLSEWKAAVFRASSEEKMGRVGRGGVLKLACYMWEQMSEAEKQQTIEKFEEHAAAYAAYESSDAYVEPEKTQKPKRQCLLSRYCGSARNGLAFAAAGRST